MRLETRSIAEPAIQDSSGFAVVIEVQSVGKACFTTVSYMPGADDFASEARISVKIERKMGSNNDIVSRQVVLLCLPGRAFVVLCPHFQGREHKRVRQVSCKPCCLVDIKHNRHCAQN
jgi:hypothetical protein